MTRKVTITIERVRRVTVRQRHIPSAVNDEGERTRPPDVSLDATSITFPLPEPDKKEK